MANQFDIWHGRQAVLKIPATAVRLSSNRLDASYYCGESAQIRDMLAAASAKLDRLGDIAAVTQPTVFGKRFMQGSSEQGIPLYPSGELLSYEPTTDSYVSRHFTETIKDLLAQTGTLLFTRSGSVGRVVLTSPTMTGAAIQDDVLKVVPKSRILANYLYIYFLSPIGQPLLGDAAFGSVIQHIKVDHIRELPVFRVSKTSEQKISDLVEQAQTIRAEGADLLNSAKYHCSTDNKLPTLDHMAHWLDRDDRHVAFNISLPEALQSQAECSELRLEAHFYNPTARTALANIRKSPSGKKTVGQLSHEVIMGGRFKRNYVEADYGTPFLSGKNIIQIRPTDLKHLSNLETDMLAESIIKRGWILVTRSGTIGRTCFVWHNFEDFTASEHILRIIPDEGQVDAGYLYAFLASPYGYEQILRFRHGSVIDEITDQQLSKVLVPLPTPAKQKDIGDKVRLAYEKRAQALKLEDQAQEILLREIKGKTTKEI